MTFREAPASVGQRVLWQMEHHRGGHGALNCPLLVRIDGRLDAGGLQAALDALARRHEALRTTFAGRGPRLRQLIHADPLPLPVAEVDLTAAEDPDAALESALAEEVQTPTSTAERPVRAALWRTAPERHTLCLTMHHLVTDGWSTAVVYDELGRLYDRLVGDGPALPPVGWQYAEWMEWQQRQLRGDELRRMQGYWRESLAGARVPGLPRRASDVPLLERRTTVERAVLPEDAVHALQQLARGRGTAFFTCLLAVYYALLERELGEGDYAVGSVFANRMRPEARSTVGFLSNMVVLRTKVRPGTSFEQIVADADKAVIGAFAHQALPFQMLPLGTIDAGSLRPDAVVFQLFTGPMAPAVRAGVRFDPVVDVPGGIGSRWEFELSVAPASDGLAVLLCYADDLFDATWARGFLDGYVALASALAHEPRAPAASLVA